MDHFLWRRPDALVVSLKIAARTKNNDPLILDTLAMAHAANEDFDSATKMAEKALSLARQQELVELANEISDRAAGYKKGIPYLLGQ